MNTDSIHNDCVPGKLVIISGPSGAGKSTVVKTLLSRSSLPLQLSISATTRAPRAGEVHGREYFFLSKEDFETRRTNGEFLECKEVFGRGDWYGTLQSVVSTGLDRGNWVILEIDVQGALSVMQHRDDPITIFVHPGSMEELESRLRLRGTETEAAIRRRLEVARDEMANRHHYRHEVINQNLDNTVDEICQLLMQYQGETSPCLKN